MAEAGVPSQSQPADPREKIDQAVIASPPRRRYRARAFQVYVLAAAALFVTLAIGARLFPYFPIDLRITQAIQQNNGFGLGNLLYAISWIGFIPQVDIIGSIVVLSLYFAGLRWEAVASLFAALGIGVGTITKIIVNRPRPSADLVHVISQLPTSGFPSGHVLMITTFGGFLAFLSFTLLKQSLGRTLLLVFFGLLILLMGVSRIELGHHWFSDVLGAYMLGSLWLALTIRFYRWGKPKFFVHQPVAPEVPVASAH
jgi:membrane-associated phospholipid phosphatase